MTVKCIEVEPRKWAVVHVCDHPGCPAHSPPGVTSPKPIDIGEWVDGQKQDCARDGKCKAAEAGWYLSLLFGEVRDLCPAHVRERADATPHEDRLRVIVEVLMKQVADTGVSTAIIALGLDDGGHSFYYVKTRGSCFMVRGLLERTEKYIASMWARGREFLVFATGRKENT